MTKNHLKSLCFNKLFLKTFFYKILSIWRKGYFLVNIGIRVWKNTYSDSPYEKLGPNALILFMFMVKITFLYKKSNAYYMVLWLLSARKSKVKMSWLPSMQYCSENQKVIYSILSKACREFNSHRFGPFPIEKNSILAIVKCFKWNGSTFYPMLGSHMT